MWEHVQGDYRPQIVKTRETTRDVNHKRLASA